LPSADTQDAAGSIREEHMAARFAFAAAVALAIASFALSATDAAAQCKPATEEENVAVAKAWHEDVINLRNPAKLKDILADSLVHHAAGGYPATMNAAGVAAMMDDFLIAFPDLRYTFDHFIAKGDYVVERYTATGTQHGPLGALKPSGRRATWTGMNIFRLECGKIVEVWSQVDAIARNRQLTGR
jgi:predicted ester cyclase